MFAQNYPKLVRDSGFVFDSQHTQSHINWSDIRVVDIDTVIRERDFVTVDSNIHNVINCQLEFEFDVRILDTGFVKLFRLGQLAIEYLLQCRRHLDLATMSLKSDLDEAMKEIDFLKKQLKNREEDFNKLKQRFKKRHKYSKNNDLSAILKNISIQNEENADTVLNQCLECDKIFLNQYYLRAHTARRHGLDIDDSKYDLSTNKKLEPRDNILEKFQLEIKDLKDRINTAEKKYIAVESDTSINVLQKEDVESAEKDLQKSTSIDTHNVTLDDFVKWKKYEETKTMNFINNFNQNLTQSLANINNKLISLEEEQHKKLDSDKIEIIASAVVDKISHEKIKNESHSEPSNNIVEITTQIEKDWNVKFNSLETQHLHIIEDLKSSIASFISQSQNIQQTYIDKINQLEGRTIEQMKISKEQEKLIKVISEDTHNIQTQVLSPNEFILKQKLLHNGDHNKKYENETKIHHRDEESNQHDDLNKDNSSKKDLSEDIEIDKSLSNSDYSTDSDKKITEKFPINLPSGNLKTKSFKELETTNKNYGISQVDKVNSKKLSPKNFGNKEQLDMKKRLEPTKYKNALKSDLNDLMNKQLQRLGLPSDCKKISSKNFETKMDTVMRKRKLLNKKYKQFRHIRKGFEDRINLKVEFNYDNAQKEMSVVPTSKFNKSMEIMGSILSSVKNKAAYFKKSTENLKVNLKKYTSSLETGVTSDIDRNYSSDSTRKLSAKSLLAMAESKNYPSSEVIVKKKKLRDKIDSSIEESFDDGKPTGDFTVGLNKNNVTSDQIQSLLASPIKKPPLDEFKNRRFSKASYDKSKDMSSSESITTDDMFERKLENFPLSKKSLSDGNFNRNNMIASPKGVLKSVSSTSSLMKKRVLFDLDSNVTRLSDLNDNNQNNLADEMYDKSSLFKENNTKSVSVMEMHNLKPTVSNESLFQTRSTQRQNFGVRVENSENNLHDLSVKQPIPAPRLYSMKENTNTDSDLDLSDWSGDDIINNKIK